MLNIIIKTIPYTDMRYPSVGDYWTEANGQMVIVVADMKNPTHELGVALHELVEFHLCDLGGISEQSITDFDIQFEKNRALFDDSEPGDSLDAPYREEHRFAENIERQFIHECGINWAEYDQNINKLFEMPSNPSKEVQEIQQIISTLSNRSEK